MPIDQINGEKIIVYGFPEEPYMVTGKSYKGKNSSQIICHQNLLKTYPLKKKLLVNDLYPTD